MRKLLPILALILCAVPCFATPQTWFVRGDGGTRYSAYNTSGQCDGQGDAAYVSGVNQHCAYNQVPYLWDVGMSTYLGAGWVISGGDTVVIRGCAGAAGCRVGWSASTGAANIWCYGAGNTVCFNPAIPVGSSGAHTRILGGCAYDSTPGPCNSGNVTNRANLSQIFGGYGLNWTLNLKATQYVDVQGIEITEHNGVCVRHGSPAWPRYCVTSQPVDDYADSGLLLDNTTAHLLLQDVYIHGFTSAGMQGPIGGAITMTRVSVNFNAFVGWTFDDGSDTANASGASINASYVEMTGNGFFEEYPIVHAFPAVSGYSSNFGGFGDSWSGQDGPLDTFTCDHCTNNYNVKDAFIGPHTQISHLTVTNSTAIGNMGAVMKFALAPGGTALFRNNLFTANCARMQAILPGAVQNFNSTTGLNGSYLYDYCRGNASVASLERSGSNTQWVGNTIIPTFVIMFQQNCGYYTIGNSFHPETDCGDAVSNYTDNLFLGYTDPAVGVDPPQGWYREQCSAGIGFTADHNLEYNIQAGPTDGCGAGVPPVACGTNGELCTSPLLTSQPTTPWCGSEACMDVFIPSGNSFYPSGASPLIAAGVAVSGLTTDYYGTSRSSPPWIGAVNSLLTSAGGTVFNSVVSGSSVIQ